MTKAQTKKTVCCKECGSQDFFILEDYTWKAYYDEEGEEMVAKNPNSEILEIRCEMCNEELKYEGEVNFQ